MVSLYLYTLLAAASLDAAKTTRPLATVTLGSPEWEHSQSVEISLVGEERAASEAALAERSWIAVRRSSHGSEDISSEECPALRDVALEFRRLPPITPSPLAAIVADEPLPVNLIMLHGWKTSINYKTLSGAEVTVSGMDAYGSWGTRVANSLIPCWKLPFP